MKQSIEKFLEFKGKTLLFTSKEGITWIAVKPICEALQVNYKQQHANILDDPILGPVSCNHRMQVEDDQARIMTCLPEKFIYGWIFSIQSKSQELQEYKKQCYEILFDYFHGTITKRKNLIHEQVITARERGKIELALRENPEFMKYEELKAYEMRIGKELKKLDEDIKTEQEEQLGLFD